MDNKDHLEDVNKRRLIFSYIEANDEVRIRGILKDMNPLDARMIVMEGTDLTMLHLASLKGSLIIQNWLMDKMNFPPDLDSNSEIWSPAHVAAIGGKDLCLEALLMRKPEIVNRPDKRFSIFIKSDNIILL